jgi:phospholipid transport system substrate-binding protein
MKYFNLWLRMWALVMAGGLFQLPALAAEPHPDPRTPERAPAPETVIGTAIDDLATLIKHKPADTPGEAFRTQVGELLDPYFDLPLMSRLAVGKHWRSASPQQRERLTREYRKLLVATYSVPLRALRESRVSVRSADHNDDNSRARVTVDVTPPDDPALVLIFSLYRKDKRWLVYDMSVEGVSLTTNYRSEFSAVINRQGLDGLIARLADKNRKRDTEAL